MPTGYKGLHRGLNQLVTTMWWRDLAHLDLMFDEMIVFFGSTLKTLKILLHLEVILLIV